MRISKMPMAISTNCVKLEDITHDHIVSYDKMSAPILHNLYACNK